MIQFFCLYCSLYTAVLILSITCPIDTEISNTVVNGLEVTFNNGSNSSFSAFSDSNTDFNLQHSYKRLVVNQAFNIWSLHKSSGPESL